MTRDYDFEEVAGKYAPLIAGVARSYSLAYRNYRVEMDDLVQIALISLWQAMQYVDIMDPSHFTYARAVIVRSVRQYVYTAVTRWGRGHRFAQGGEWINEHNAVHEELVDFASPNEDGYVPYDIPVEDSHFSLMVEDFASSLNEQEKQALRHHMRDRQGSRKGRHVAGLSRATYYRRLADVREKLLRYEEGGGTL